MRSRMIHNDKYDYSKSIYINHQTKVCIICPIHGEFWQRPNDHLTGKGCKYCAGNQNKNTETFIQEATTKFGDTFDYSKVEYKGAHKDVCIICYIHGEFWQSPTNHLSGRGCKYCAGFDKTTETFIEELNQIHDNRFDYSKVDYINNSSFITIICPEHGEFRQNASSHLGGCGCPRCKESKLESIIARLLKENNIEYITEKKFDWLKYENPLRLDFYLPEYNIAIECQGKQHFESSNFYGGIDTLCMIKERDKTKFELCTENGVKILYFTQKRLFKYSNDYLGELIIDKDKLLQIIKSL